MISVSGSDFRASMVISARTSVKVIGTLAAPPLSEAPHPSEASSAEGYPTKIASGRNADTSQLGASTTSLTFRSTATEQRMYASSRLRSCTRTR